MRGAFLTARLSRLRVTAAMATAAIAVGAFTASAVAPSEPEAAVPGRTSSC